MIRVLALAALLLLPAPAIAAPSDVVEPALQQCILSATTRSEDDSGPIITDCISVGSNACQNEPGGSSNAGIVRCDGIEEAFWTALMTFEYGELVKKLKPDALASLKAAQKAWTPWRLARCDFVKKSQPDATLVAVDVSYCKMETTAQRAIDLMAAL